MVMKDRFGFVLLFSLVVGMSACRSANQAAPTPGPDYAPISSEPLIVSLADLAESPEAYEGAYLQVQGQYHRLPLLFCSAASYPAPASWKLASDSVEIKASGFDSQLRRLIANDVMITVTGRWRFWQGLVGCDKKAIQQQIWYLQVDDILSPDPIVQATPMPAGPDADVIAAQPTPISSPTIPTETATALPEAGATVPPGTPAAIESESATATIIFSPTPSLPAAGQETATSTNVPAGSGTATNTPTASTTTTSTAATPSPTGTRQAIVPTATGASPTATQSSLATATIPLSNFTVEDQGVIADEELVGGFLDTRRIHRWTFSVTAGETITVSAAMPSTGDMVLTVKDEAGNQVAEQNNASAGVVETMAGLSISQAGNYQLEIRAANGAASPYALFLLYSGSYAFVAQEILNFNTTRSGSLAAEHDHFWFFEGNTGDSVTITVVPNDNGDLFLELYGANGDKISDFVDDGQGGQQEQLALFELPEYGIYTIHVGEYNFSQSNYQLSLTKN
jgi:hypothetical protein